MSEGPFGFPRLTTLGPLVKPSKIHPFKDIPTGVYSIKFIEETQQLTGIDTIRALEDIIEFELDSSNNLYLDAEFEYRKERLSNILEVNSFSSALLDAMSKAENNGIPLKGAESRTLEIENAALENEVRSHMQGDNSIFTDELLSSIDMNWKRIQNGQLSIYENESKLRSMVVDKVVSDFHRVTIINDDIRSSREYFPPTTENIGIGAPLDWGTLDGAHRIVSLSQILGADQEIFIWEWENQQSFIDNSSNI